MLVKEGKSVFNGVAIGKIFVYRKADKAVSQNQVEDTAAEMARFEAAKEKAMSQLKGLYEKALKDVGEEEAMILMSIRCCWMIWITMNPFRIS